jgi:DNA polymerase-3 subunit alpha
MSYVPLHVHSIYSPFEGMMTIGELVSRAAFLKLPAIALTDHWTTYGHYELFRSAREAGVKPVFGAELQHSSMTGHRELYHLTALAENIRGYRNLVSLVIKHHRKEKYQYVTPEELTEHSEGLIVLSGCHRGEASQAILHGNLGRARDALECQRDTFSVSSFFVELMNHNEEDEGLVIDQLIIMSRKLEIPLVVTNNDRYLQKDDLENYRMLKAMRNKRFENGGESIGEYYLKKEKDLEPYFYTHRDALEQSAVIAERCNVDLVDSSRVSFSGLPSPDDHLSEMCRRRFILKFHSKSPDEKARLNRILNKELESARREMMAGFLIFLKQLLHRCAARGAWFDIMGGSLLESLTAYLLGIVPLNPVDHDLIFESFNSSRPGVPSPIELINSRGNKDKMVAIIEELLPGYRSYYQVTREEMSFHRIVKEIGELVGIPDDLLTELYGILMSERRGRSLASLIESSEPLRHLYKREALVRKTLHTAQALHGKINHFSLNSSRMILLPTDVEDCISHVTIPEAGRFLLISSSLAEAIGGWIILVQRSHFLSALESVVAELERNRSQLPSFYSSDDENGKEWTPEMLSDPQTYGTISSGETTGIYLLESQGIRDLLIKIKPSQFDELVNVISLYRPAPLEGKLWQRYIENAEKKGKVYLPHASMAPPLEKTRGLLLYREQVREILSCSAGLDGERAIAVENALIYRDSGELLAARLDFIRGAINNDIDEEDAQKIFDFLLHNIAFTHDKALSCSQAYLSYRTAFFKTHFFNEYFAALLNFNMDVKDRQQRYLKYLEEMDIKVLPLDINTSGEVYNLEQNGIRAPLQAAKFIERGEVKEILAERSGGGDFESLSDFLNRMFGRISMRSVMGLIEDGAFDFGGLDREELSGLCKDFFEGGGEAGLFAPKNKRQITTTRKQVKPKNQLSLFDE